MAAVTDQATDPQTDSRCQDDGSSINSALFDILPENIPNTIITKAPEERFRLGYWSVVGLVVNRVIGQYQKTARGICIEELTMTCRNRHIQFAYDHHARY